MENTIKALIATKRLLSTKKNGDTVEVWKASQHLGDFEREGDKIKAIKYVLTGLTTSEEKLFDNESDAINWLTE